MLENMAVYFHSIVYQRTDIFYSNDDQISNADMRHFADEN